ncbi:uncharacterized protein ATNIH1004_004227 [Aspergillus tanneri]|uniref:Uncharacterized protein n=1 Tax=Aspergillus tanneri TaxID=1220188 RepID=A0A5M9MMT4_9EURO|nr:uncharacterized protein ATNIH1004_004227 [Aspergillus tanneri]KAA8648342.1 hypothetical protein ATNIH1004_004227 [Aspergillus tanneri]
MSTTHFFDAFPNFRFNPNAPIGTEFHRLAQQRNWRKGSKTWRRNWNLYISSEYDRIIGQALPAGLEDWQDLCDELDLQGSFTSITKCKQVRIQSLGYSRYLIKNVCGNIPDMANSGSQALSRVHVNIVDLIECRQIGRRPRKFPNVSALADYTQETQRFFRRDVAKQDKLLRTLLRRLA